MNTDPDAVADVVYKNSEITCATISHSKDNENNDSNLQDPDLNNTPDEIYTWLTGRWYNWQPSTAVDMRRKSTAKIRVNFRQITSITCSKKNFSAS